MGVGFDNLTKSEFTARAESMLQNGERGYVVTPNAEIVYESIHDDGFRALLNGASMVLPDGAGVVLGAKILGTPIREKVAGIEFGEEVCRILAKNQGRLYLLGSKPGIAKAAGEKLAEKYPGLPGSSPRCSGTRRYLSVSYPTPPRVLRRIEFRCFGKDEMDPRFHFIIRYGDFQRYFVNLMHFCVFADRRHNVPHIGLAPGRAGTLHDLSPGHLIQAGKGHHSGAVLCQCHGEADGQFPHGLNGGIVFFHSIISFLS